MSILFTALPYLPPSLILPILPCIPLCMPSLAFSSALARLSQQNPWKHQPRVGRGRGVRLSLCPHGGQGQPAGLQGPLVAAGSRGTCGDIPASRGAGECLNPAGMGKGLLPTASPEQPQLLLFCRRKEKGNQGLFSPLGWMKSQGEAFSKVMLAPGCEAGDGQCQSGS